MPIRTRARCLAWFPASQARQPQHRRAPRLDWLQGRQSHRRTNQRYTPQRLHPLQRLQGAQPSQTTRHHWCRTDPAPFHCQRHQQGASCPCRHCCRTAQTIPCRLGTCRCPCCRSPGLEWLNTIRLLDWSSACRSCRGTCRSRSRWHPSTPARLHCRRFERHQCRSE